MAIKKHKYLKLMCLVVTVFIAGVMISCGNNSEVDFVKKYNVDLANAEDVSELLQKAIDALPENGVLFLQDGTYPIKTALEFQSNMTFQLSDNAVLVNEIPDKSALMAFNHPLKHDKAEGNSNITIEGGIWNMNGAVGADGVPQNLPNAETAGALGLAYASNITLRNITFKDSFNGHVMQLCAVDQVLVENCRFEGQGFLGNGNRTRELIQIEPGSIKGYPYTKEQDVKPTTNVTIKGCHFGGSELSPQYMVAIGNHGQQNGVKCSDIIIEDCTFENAAWAAIRFWAYDRVTIQNNRFFMSDDSTQKDRYAILADSHPQGAVIAKNGAENTTELVIQNNTFSITAEDVRAIGIKGNGGSPKKPKNVSILENTITGNNTALAIDLYRVENCVIENNVVDGFVRHVYAEKSNGQVTTDLEAEYAE